MPVACKPKHDYQQGLLGMGKEGGCRCWCTHALGGATVQAKHLMLVPAVHEEVGM